MIEDTPGTFQELAAWLSGLTTAAGPLPVVPEPHFHKIPSSLDLWLLPLDRKHGEAIGDAVDQLCSLEAEAFDALEPEARALLALRLLAAEQLVEDLSNLTAPPPFDYSKDDFRELVRWLLVDWWEGRGAHRGKVHLFLRQCCN